MPAGIGYPGRPGGGLAARSLAQQGISQPGIVPTSPSDEEQINQLLRALKSGQVGAENLMAFLALLTQAQMPGGPPGPPGPPGPRGPQRAPGGRGRGGPPQRRPSPIQGALG